MAPPFGLPIEVATKFDYEVELLVVIGRRAHNVTLEDRPSSRGILHFERFSARDLQLELDGHQWMIGKTLDDFAPIGPYSSAPIWSRIRTTLNIECARQRAKPASTPTRVHWCTTTDFLCPISAGIFPLEPGDLIFTGTRLG